MSDTKPYQFIPNLAELLKEAPEESIVSRTFVKEDALKAVMFAFDAGQSLSEHSAGQNAVLHILTGEATLVLGTDIHEVGAGAWVYMPARLRHSVVAKTPMTFLLLLIKEG